MPDIRNLQLSGASKARVSGFRNLNRLDADLKGAVEAEFDVRADRLSIDAAGASKTTLKGRARQVDISLAGACQLNGTEMQIEEADVKAIGASRAEFGKIPKIRKVTVGPSKIESSQ